MRRIWAVLCLGSAIAACGGESLTLSEYATRSEGLVTGVITSLDMLDAEWESQSPTLEGAQAYWDRRLEARVAFLEGIRELEPPDEMADFHEMALDLFSRLNAAEEALAARVAILETVTEHGQWWETTEGQAARAVDAEAVAICRAAQAELDATEDSDAFTDVPWVPGEVREAVRVAFGCP